MGNRFFRRPGMMGVLAAMVAIVWGLILGFLLLLLFNAPFAGYGMGRLLTAGLRSGKYFAEVLYRAAPLLLTGLSVAFAFQTGLFNIGATGQYTVGACCTILGAAAGQWPWYLCLLAAMVGGAAWGFFPGFCKAFFQVNEVITSIMFNWIALFLVNLILANTPMALANYWGASSAERTAQLGTANPGALLPKAGLDRILGSNYGNVSIFLAIGVALVLYVILSRTTFGYELKACGLNARAAHYAGMGVRRNVVLSMVIAGALAGLAGGVYYLAGNAQYLLEKNLLPMGFNGIPVALLASSHPIGSIFSALFISLIQVGGDAMQPEFAKEVIDIIIAVIIYLAAFGVLTRSLLTKMLKKRESAAANKNADREETA